jgi:outer membrane biosynthesis protein TonB
LGPFDLPAGHTIRFKNLFVTLPKEESPERDNRYMTAILVEQPDSDIRSFDFNYVHRLGAKTLWHIEHPKMEVHHHHPKPPIQVVTPQPAPVQQAPVQIPARAPAPVQQAPVQQAPAPAPARPATSDIGDSLGPLGSGDGLDGPYGGGAAPNDPLGGAVQDNSGANPAPAQGNGTDQGAPAPGSNYDSKLLQNSILEQLPK